MAKTHRILVVAAIVVGVWAFCASLRHAWAASSPMSEQFLTIEGTQRRYLLYVPPHPVANPPVIMMLHGGGGSPEHAGARGLNQLSDEKGFLAVYPEGLHHSWNDGRLIQGRSYDDVAFLSAVIDDVVRSHQGNAKRVYVTGISNGGFMSFKLACTIPEKLAAIAPVAGSMGVGAIEECHPKRPVSVMMINGTADPIVKYDGGKVLRREGSEAEPVPTVVKFWRSEVCGADVPAAQTERLADRDPNDGSTVKIERVRCPHGDVENYTVEGGGHSWPGGAQYLPKFVVGNVNRDFDASAAIVNFFETH